MLNPDAAPYGAGDVGRHEVWGMEPLSSSSDSSVATDAALHASHILIVDDEEACVRMLTQTLLRAGFRNLSSTTDPREALELCLWKQPDLILLDLYMPHRGGVEVLGELRSEVLCHDWVPVLVMSGNASTEARHEALRAGAKDFLSKPCDIHEVELRIRNHLETRLLFRDLQQQNRLLEERLRARTRELEAAQLEMLERLSRAGEYRDDDTGEHAKRVGDLSASIADELNLPPELVELIWRAAALHDVGKIGIGDAILLKPGKLTPEEMNVMRNHTEIGAQLLSRGCSPYLRVAERIARTHHEWWDGNGYTGMRGEAIPIEGRIVAVADVFDALISERPYKHAWSVEEAVAHIKKMRGRHFDPAVVDAFLRVLQRSGMLPPEQAGLIEREADPASAPAFAFSCPGC